MQTDFISEGTEYHPSGIKDNFGRDCGSTVHYGLSVEGSETYLTAYVHANRNGKDFCRKSGRMIRCEITSCAGSELAASASRTRQVNEAIAAAKERAAKRWHRYQ